MYLLSVLFYHRRQVKIETFVGRNFRFKLSKNKKRKLKQLFQNGQRNNALLRAVITLEERISPYSLLTLYVSIVCS